MTKLSLLKTISSVHAAKCNELSDFSMAVQSYNKLIELKNLVDIVNDDQLEQIHAKVQEWANEEPTVNHTFNRIQ